MNQRLSDRLHRIELQKDYCWRNGLPYFSSTEWCPFCFTPVYEYVTDEQAANTLITSCPVCHKAFND